MPFASVNAHCRRWLVPPWPALTSSPCQRTCRRRPAAATAPPARWPRAAGGRGWRSAPPPRAPGSPACPAAPASQPGCDSDRGFGGRLNWEPLGRELARGFFGGMLLPAAPFPPASPTRGDQSPTPNQPALSTAGPPTCVPAVSIAARLGLPCPRPTSTPVPPQAAAEAPNPAASMGALHTTAPFPPLPPHPPHPTPPVSPHAP